LGLQRQQTLIYQASMQVITETELLERIQAFRERHEMSPTTFGRKATGNANLIRELEDGRSPSLRTVQRIVGFMAEADAEALLRAKLDAPPPLAEEGERELPFSSAPVSRTGASSLTSSSTSAQPTSPRENGSCPVCSTVPPDAETQQNPSCSAEERK
jgi:hypothetical protein